MKGYKLVSTITDKPKGFPGLVQITKLNLDDKNHVNASVIEIISDLDILILSYNMIPEIYEETLDGISLSWFKKLSKQLREGSFSFRSSCRVDISKSKDGTRSLGVVSPRDKIVQQAMLMVLTAVFENNFLNSSHGFRPNKSCHTALKYIQLKFGSINWFIEGDISKCFDSLDHKLLILAVNERIKDQVFIDLLYKALRAGYIDINKVYHPSSAVTHQNFIISPILCNILLHKFDSWMQTYIEYFNKGTRCKANLIYTHPVRGNSSLSTEQRRKNLVHIHEKKIHSFMSIDPSFKRLFYVRYAGDFLIGVIGSKMDCLKIIKDIEDYLRDFLKLTFSLTKTSITHAATEKVHFLGTDISITPFAKRLIKPVISKKELEPVLFTPRLILNAPIKKIVAKLVEKKFARKGAIGQPTRVGRFIHFDISLIYDSYNSIARGLLTYYSYVSNYARFRARVLYILQYSLALTLASKFKLGTLHKVFKKYGPNLKYTDKPERVFQFNTNLFVKSAPGFMIRSGHYNPLRNLEIASSRLPRTKKLLMKSCHVCGTDKSVEVPHVKHICKHVQAIKRNLFLKIRSNMNQK
jgi:group II intron reverse transcriptase/maturase